MSATSKARAAVLEAIKNTPGGRVEVSILAAALGLRMRAAVEDLMSDGLVMPHPDGTVSLTPRGVRELGDG